MQSILTLVQGMVPTLVISAPVRSPAILGASPPVRGYSLSVLTSNKFYTSFPPHHLIFSCPLQIVSHLSLLQALIYHGKLTFNKMWLTVSVSCGQTLTLYNMYRMRVCLVHRFPFVSGVLVQTYINLE